MPTTLDATQTLTEPKRSETTFPSSFRRLHVALIMLAAFVVRMAVIFWCRTYAPMLVEPLPGRLIPTLHHFNFGYETGAIAGSIAAGHGFASPFEGLTGYTAWISPIYPYICAFAFKLFGSFTFASAIAILTVNSLFSALTVPFIVRIGEKTFGRNVGIAAAWIWAAGLFFTRWPTTWVWDMSLSALLLTMAIDQALALADTLSYKRWIGFGLLWAIIALSNPSMMVVLGVSGVWLAFRHNRNLYALVRPAALASLTLVIAISPWIIRNRLVFGEWVFLRGNAGFELSLGNYPSSNGLGWLGFHPTQNRWEYAKYQRLGELQYVKIKEQQAISYIKSDPEGFLTLSAKRFYYFWAGTAIDHAPPDREMWKIWMFWPLSVLTALGAWLAIRNHIGNSLMLFACVVFYPTAYYFIYAQVRYRHAVEPVMLLFSVYLLFWPVRMIENWSAKKQITEPVLSAH